MRLIIVIVILLAMGPPAIADETEAWTALRNGEAVLMMRHALAPGTGDPANFDINDCSTQRNLSERGREQAKSWKAYLSRHGINQARVFSSQWCRCMDTATSMAMGPVTELPSLNSFFRNRSRADQQTAETIRRVNAMPDGPPIILVSHQVNTTALTGIFPASNQGVILALPLTQTPEILARVAPGQ